MIANECYVSKFTTNLAYWARAIRRVATTTTMAIVGAVAWRRGATSGGCGGESITMTTTIGGALLGIVCCSNKEINARLILDQS